AVSHGPDLPAFETCGRNQHRKICFAAGAGKGCSDVSLLALRIFYADDEHMLGHPAFITGDVRSDAQRETFLAEQCVPTVAGTVRPDLANLRKMNDVLFVVARPGNILFAVRERR